MKDKTMLINILAGIGAFFLLSSAWVIGVLIVSYKRHKASAALQPRTAPIARTGIIRIHAPEANPPFGELSKYTQAYPTWEPTIRPEDAQEAVREAQRIMGLLK